MRPKNNDQRINAPWPNSQPIRICALRVEFQPDNLTGTTGDGTMGSFFPDSLTLDPLPHDRAYFEDHLQFLQNYYRKVSKDNLTFGQVTVFPAADDSAYQLDYPMWHYNFNTDDDLLNRRLTELFVQATIKAHNDGIDFRNFDAIIIFHAGTGKDFNLGFDSTPFDLPSAYITPDDIARYWSESVPLGVHRGLILPEAENQQEGLDLGIELSLNGVMVKLFGNWLGLPDLFDTETGRSGIGRWGMMDQGSGNVLATVPALPDAWSRVFMGWDIPYTIIPTAAGDTFQVARFDTVENTPEILKVPVTTREYYLIENRDADNDSIGHVTLFDRNTDSLWIDNENNVHKFGNFIVPVRASHYDYGIPGSGLLIWHIDEDVIESGYNSNRVNTNRDHRGVDLVEADGSQDIGYEYGFATAGSGTELGIQEDAWWSANRNHREANGNTPTVVFNDRRLPSARLYDGAFTNIELKSFSDISPTMSFVARNTILEKGFPIKFTSAADWSVADLNNDGYKEIYFIVQDSLYMTDSSGITQPLLHLPNAMFLTKYANMDLNNDNIGELVIMESDELNEIRLGIIENVNGAISVRFSDPMDSAFTSAFPAKTNLGNHRIISIFQSTGIVQINLWDYDLTQQGHLVLPSPSGGFGLYNIGSFPSQRFLFQSGDSLYCLSILDSAFDIVWQIPFSEAPGMNSPQVLHQPDSTWIYFSNHGYFLAESGMLRCNQTDCAPPQIDWNNDGYFDGGGPRGNSDLQIEDYPNWQGSDYQEFIDIDIDNKPDILDIDDPSSGGGISRIYAIKHNGGNFFNTPIAVSNMEFPPRYFTWNTSQILNFVTSTQLRGNFYYSINKIPVQAANGTRFNYTEPLSIINIGNPNSQAYNRSDWVYCWPNPTADSSHIRITLPYAAEAKIKIFDLAGRIVSELNGNSSIPGQFEVNWNARNVESGVYIGQVEVSGSGGNRRSHIKIAVVK